MSKSTSFTGNDTIQIDSRVLNDLADGDVAKLSHPNDLATVKSGKNGNVIYGFNASGLQCDFEIRVIRGQSDDKYLNSRLQEFKNDPASFIMLTGNFVKRCGDGKGGITNEVYQLSGGVFKRDMDATSNVEGASEQSVSVYRLTFGNNVRTLQ